MHRQCGRLAGSIMSQCKWPDTPWFSWPPKFMWQTSFPDLWQSHGTKTGHVQPKLVELPWR